MSPEQEAAYRRALRAVDERREASSRHVQAQDVAADDLVARLAAAGTPVEFVARSVEHLGPPGQDAVWLRAKIRGRFARHARDLPAWGREGEAWPLPDDLDFALDDREKRALLGEVRDVRELASVAHGLLDAFWNLDGVLPVAFVACVLTPAGIPLGMDVKGVRRLVDEQARKLEGQYDHVGGGEVRELARMLALGAKLAAGGRSGKASRDPVEGMVAALARSIKPIGLDRGRLEAIVRAEAESVGLEVGKERKREAGPSGTGQQGKRGSRSASQAKSRVELDNLIRETFGEG